MLRSGDRSDQISDVAGPASGHETRLCVNWPHGTHDALGELRDLFASSSFDYNAASASPQGARQYPLSFAACRGLFDNGISGRVPAGIVEVLEAAEIEQRGREAFAVSLRITGPARSRRLALIIGLRRSIAEAAEEIGAGLRGFIGVCKT